MDDNGMSGPGGESGASPVGAARDGARGGATGGGARPASLRRRALLAAGAGAVVAGLAGAASAGAESARPADRTGAKPAPSRTPSAVGPRPFYIGTYTSSSGQGVGLATYNPQTGAITATGTVAGVANPSFLAVSGTHLYTVNEQPGGKVTAVSIPAGSAPRVLNSQSTGGSGPCHLSVHPGGRHLLSANYDSGSVAVHPIAADGSLQARSGFVQHTGSGPDPDRQSGPHAHQVLSDPQGGFVLSVDLGTDTVYTSRLDTATGKLTAVSQASVQPGSGPRHLAFHPSGRFAYVACELGNSVIVCGYDPATGALTPGLPQPTVPQGAQPTERNYPAEVAVSGDGRSVSVSNRGANSIARFSVGGSGASLALLDTVPAGGAYPRHISLDPTGTLLYAANQNSGTVTVFHRDTGTGALTAAGSPFATPSPVCVLAQ
ncbi:lactonase family protein [Streptomyces sp. IBSBF 2435]|uniref:lactonase family protein n=1 Tax=Streptomyces sp. IBSBF 2435 TaxID=2903531 RepID=UPI002FDC6FDD